MNNGTWKRIGVAAGTILSIFGISAAVYAGVVRVGNGVAETHFRVNEMPAIEQRIDEKIELYSTKQTLEMERLITQLKIEIERLKAVR
jgi:uncharacterized small protein (DUF1192 family)